MSLDIEFLDGLVAYVRGNQSEIDALYTSLRGSISQIGKVPLKIQDGALVTFRGVLAWALQQELLEVGSLGPNFLTFPHELDGLLRDYQREAVMAAVKAPMMCGVVKAPTGAGKTRIAAGIMATVGGRWLLSAPSQGLLVQLKASIEELKLPDSFQMELLSFGQLSKASGRYDGLICDEAHRIAATTWSEASTNVDASYRIGMSATPLLRSDAFNPIVIGLLGPIVYDIELKRLQSDEYLAKGKIVRRTFNHG